METVNVRLCALSCFPVAATTRLVSIALQPPPKRSLSLLIFIQYNLYSIIYGLNLIIQMKKQAEGEACQGCWWDQCNKTLP